MDTKKKFFVGGLPDAPFDHHWVLSPVYEVIRTVHPERVETKEVLVRDRWQLSMVRTGSDTAVRWEHIKGLSDEEISAAAKLLVIKFVSRNRAAALEEGPVSLSN